MKTNNKLIGIILATAFFIFGTINCILFDVFMHTNVLGVFVIGLLYLGTSVGDKTGKILQVILTTILGCFTLVGNDINSFASLFVLGISFHMYVSYFKNQASHIYLIPIPYLLTAFLSGWTLYAVLMNGLIYLSYTSVVFILGKQRGGSKQ